MRFHYLFDLQQEIDTTSAAHKIQTSRQEASSTPEVSTGDEEDSKHRPLQEPRSQPGKRLRPRTD